MTWRQLTRRAMFQMQHTGAGLTSGRAAGRARCMHPALNGAPSEEGTMLNNTSGFVLLAAMASASGYAANDMSTNGTARVGQAQTSEHIRNAQVELYCDHRAKAIVAIRQATQALEAAPGHVDPVARAALEEAIWEARHNHTDEAVAALDAAMLRLNA